FLYFFFQAEDGIRDDLVTGVQTCALPILFPISIGCSICKKMSPSSATDYNGSGREEFLSKHCEIHWLYTVLLTQLLVVLHISSRSEERRVGKECSSICGV